MARSRVGALLRLSLIRDYTRQETTRNIRCHNHIKGLNVDPLKIEKQFRIEKCQGRTG